MSAGEEPPECDREDCDRTSAYLLTSGDLCEEHAAEAEPAVVEYLRATLGRPPAAEGDDDPFVTDGGRKAQVVDTPDEDPRESDTESWEDIVTDLFGKATNIETAQPDDLLGRRIQVDWGAREDVGEIVAVQDFRDHDRELKIRIETDTAFRDRVFRPARTDCELVEVGDE